MVTAADFDGDGMTDLAAGPADYEEGTTLVLRRVSWSSPPSLADYELTRYAFGAGFAVDVDGDGDTDLVGDRVARNVRFHGASGGGRQQLHEGTPGEAGAVPVWGASGPFRAGEVEVLRLTGVPGPTVAWLAWSLGKLQQPISPLPGLNLWLDPSAIVTVTLPITSNGYGRAAAMSTLPVFLPSGLLGMTFYSQALVFDGTAPAMLTQSNVLRQYFGN